MSLMKDLTNFDKVYEFCMAFGDPYDLPLDHNTVPDLERVTNIMLEEFEEIDAAIEPIMRLMKRNIAVGPHLKAALLKELVDGLYTIYFFAATFGLNVDVAYNRVHKSNLTKLGEDGKPIRREDGKVLKGPNYQPPNLKDLIE